MLILFWSAHPFYLWFAMIVWFVDDDTGDVVDAQTTE